MKKYLILGASRGLGKSLFDRLHSADKESQFLLVSRKIEEKLILESSRIQVLRQDFSKLPVDDLFFKSVIAFQPTHIIYCAGGGPYGIYQDKKWSDHMWSFHVNFLFPAQLIHRILSFKNEFINLKKMICVGSQIAESSPDINAASYCAGKHALKGLLSTLIAENKNSANHSFSIQLYSPGYIKTDMLPEKSGPRLNNLAQDVSVVAQELAELIDSNDELS